MELVSRSELRWSLVRAMAMIATLVVLFAAVASKFGEDGRSLWFDALKKPGGILSPEGFTLWWALIFLLLGLALAILWQARGATFRRWALFASFLLLGLGLVWSPVTFGLRNLALGTGIAGAMSLAALTASYFSFRVRKSAGLLILIVTGWTVFCAYAAGQLWQLNGAAPVVTATDQPNMAGSTTAFGN